MLDQNLSVSFGTRNIKEHLNKTNFITHVAHTSQKFELPWDA
jgi:hypothetical protein